MVIIFTHCSFVLQFRNKDLFYLSRNKPRAWINQTEKRKEQLRISILIKFPKISEHRDDWRFFLDIFSSKRFSILKLWKKRKFRCFIMNRNFRIFQMKKLLAVFVIHVRFLIRIGKDKNKNGLCKFSWIQCCSEIQLPRFYGRISTPLCFIFCTLYAYNLERNLSWYVTTMRVSLIW